LMKYEQALSDAKDARTSPYALSQKELLKLATDLHLHKGVTIDTNINHVQTMAFVTNGTLGFIFEVPILTSADVFNIYLITPVPVFGNNKTFVPDIDATNIAIDAKGSSYTTLTEQELTKCLDIPPICKSSRPTYPLTHDAMCVVSSYTTDKRMCPLKETPSKPEPFLFFENLAMFYSVPNPTTVYVKCDKQLDRDFRQDGTTEVKGIGEVKFRPGCTINVHGSGTAYKTPSISHVQNIENWPIFDLKRSLPADVSSEIHFKQQDIDLSTMDPFVQASSFTPIIIDNKPGVMEVFSEIYMTIIACAVAFCLAILCSLAVAWCKKSDCGRKTVQPSQPPGPAPAPALQHSISIDDILAQFSPVPGPSNTYGEGRNNTSYGTSTPTESNHFSFDRNLDNSQQPLLDASIREASFSTLPRGPRYPPRVPNPSLAHQAPNPSPAPRVPRPNVPQVPRTPPAEKPEVPPGKPLLRPPLLKPRVVFTD